MTADDIFDLMRMCSGYWPSPELAEDEIRAWRRTLAPLDLHAASAVLEGFIAAGNHWRPTASEFTAAYRRYRDRDHHFLPVDRGAPQLEISTEKRTPQEWMARIREQLAGMSGPMASSLAGSVSGDSK